GLQWSRKEGHADFYDAKGDVEALLLPRRASFEPAEHPALHAGRCARVRSGERHAGVAGELQPPSRQQWDLPHAPGVFELDLDAVAERDVPSFVQVPKFQPAERDIAIIVSDTVTHDALMEAVHSAQTGGLLQGAQLFDVYKPKQAGAGLAANEKSLAVRL